MAGIFSSRNQQSEEQRPLQRQEEQAKAWSDEIDLNIKRESKSFKRQCDVLLISIPESEAAAYVFIKCMKTQHDSRPNDELARFQVANEKLIDFRPIIRKNLLVNSRSVARSLQSRNVGSSRHSNKLEANCEYIMSHPTDTDSPGFSFLPKFGRVVQALWAEEIIPVLLDHPSTFSVDENAAYFFVEAQRVIAEEYVPCIDDILHVVERGVLETYFQMGQQSIRVLQVYGQETERRKWIHLFQDVTSIIFYASLSDYNESTAGWGVETRLAESLDLFESVVNSHWFLRKSSIIILLTDFAEFTTKIHQVPLGTYFPEYTGGADANEGANYILSQFVRRYRSGLNIYAHITEDSDINNLRVVFAALKDSTRKDSLGIL